MDILKSFYDKIEKLNPVEICEDAFLFSFSKSKTLGVFAIVHGDEVIGLHILNELLQMILDQRFVPEANLIFALGNKPAFLNNKRLCESDLNRSFFVPHAESLEEKRASELEAVLAHCDVLIDIHQTVQPTRTPFFIFNRTGPNLHWASLINEGYPIVAYEGPISAKSKGKSMVEALNQMGGAGAVIELGEKGYDPQQLKTGVEMIQRALKKCSVPLLESGIPIPPNVFTWGDSVPVGEGWQLIEGLVNFDRLEKGTVVATSGHREFLVKESGPLLFPKYGEIVRHAGELVRVLRPLKDS